MNSNFSHVDQLGKNSHSRNAVQFMLYYRTCTSQWATCNQNARHTLYSTNNYIIEVSRNLNECIKTSTAVECNDVGENVIFKRNIDACIDVPVSIRKLFKEVLSSGRKKNEHQHRLIGLHEIIIIINHQHSYRI